MKNTFLYLLGLTLLVASCAAPKGGEAEAEAAAEEAPALTQSQNPTNIIRDGLSFYPLEGSPMYADAGLSLDSMSMSEAGEATFNFAVTNYELGAQTAGADTKGLANSGKGQHIHFIVDNGPYSAHYEPTVTKEMDDENHVVLAFLSRSYHESVKNATSWVVEEVGPNEKTVDFSAPHMFYSRPKGTYVGADTDNLMLDFFLLNVDLSEDGYKVIAEINGTAFSITEWQPYIVAGLPKGTIKVRLQLVDANGELVPGPFNDVTREVVLEEAAAE
ncbi:MAG: hypothetical protein AAF824_12200 [Bacteroidota bacterium]